MEPSSCQWIINPAAGRGRVRRRLPRLLQEFAAGRIPGAYRLTDRPGQASGLAREAAERGARTVIAVGGDGTVNEVVNGLMGAGNPELCLGILPWGSGNDFARALGLPPQPWAALELIRRALESGAGRWVDLGRLGERYFVNGLGLGLDGAVAWRNSRLKRLRGEWAYLWGGVREALAFKDFPLVFRTPDWRYEGPALLSGACLGPFQGGNFCLAPQAELDDGRLDCYLIEDLPILERLWQMPKLRRGSHLQLQQVHLHQASWLSLETDRPLPAHLDGEPFILAPGRHLVQIEARALQVLGSANLCRCSPRHDRDSV
ncbi:MAG TPA: diacylglycerol kinase family lipid kinase [Candidatus Fraserbacteria bacterium]|nr:diacylglycerol kinase family lipid kinase [Candidatus Fraserbacteria bacterium]